MAVVFEEEFRSSVDADRAGSVEKKDGRNDDRYVEPLIPRHHRIQLAADRSRAVLPAQFDDS
jgi:hypothetical protein